MSADLRLTHKQAELLDRLVDTYIDALAESQENRGELNCAKRIRTNLRRLTNQRKGQTPRGRKP